MSSILSIYVINEIMLVNLTISLMRFQNRRFFPVLILFMLLLLLLLLLLVLLPLSWFLFAMSPLPMLTLLFVLFWSPTASLMVAPLSLLLLTIVLLLFLSSLLLPLFPLFIVLLPSLFSLHLLLLSSFLMHIFHKHDSTVYIWGNTRTRKIAHIQTNWTSYLAFVAWILLLELYSTEIFEFKSVVVGYSWLTIL